MKFIASTIGASIAAAISSSLCCIVPALAFIAGIGGGFSAIEWVAPFRPYLIGLTILMLGFAWMQNLRQGREVAECDCTSRSNAGFFKGKTFLGALTVVSVLMLTVPYYIDTLIPHETPQANAVSRNVSSVTLDISGMDCEACTRIIERDLLRDEGIATARLDCSSSRARIEYDSTIVRIQTIVGIIEASGYTATEFTEK